MPSEILRAPAKFDRKQFFPMERQLLVTEFLSLFHRYEYIYKPVQGGSWLSANSQWKLTDTEILKAIACCHPKFFLGCRASKSTRFAVIDIDAGSRYHNAKELKKLQQVLESAGITPGALYRSSYSDGWHLYIFFDEPIGSAELRRNLVQLLKLHNYQIDKGTLEIFPHPGQGTQGQGLRLPLQPGWAWLDLNTAEVKEDRSDLSPLQALCFFINDLNGDTNSYKDYRAFKTHVEQLAARRESILARSRKDRSSSSNVVSIYPNRKEPAGDYVTEVRAIFGKLPPGINPDVWYRGRLYNETGLTAPSQRADAVFCLGHYFFYGDPGKSLPALGYGYEQEREWAISVVLTEKHNGYSKDINKGRPEAMAQIDRAANWRPPHKRGIKHKPFEDHTPIAWKKENARRQIDARKRIKEAVQKLQELKQPFSVRDLKAQAKCSEHTLYRHQDLWKAAQEQLQANRFASVADKYNAVVGGVAAQTPPQLAVISENMPPGRLAARRIAYEITNRAQRDQKKREKTIQQEQERLDRTWRQLVHQATPEDLNKAPSEQLKASLVALVHLCQFAPCHEDLVNVQDLICSIRDKLSCREIGPIVRLNGFG